ncbi:MAG TPA: hemerythrin domain-containing protein [Iamia sp.]|nr:hemerythrin domain-containing protein [Iamia sp.]
MDTTPDLGFYFAIHRKMRSDIARAATAVATATEEDRSGRLGPLARWVAGFTHELVEHHFVEDRFFFPALRRRVPAAAAVLDALDAEHHDLDDLLDRWPAAVAALADRRTAFGATHHEAVEVTQGLADRLGPHLDREDADVLPLFWRHLSGTEYAELQQSAIDGGKKTGLGFVVPWNASCVEGAERDALLAQAGLAMRVLLRLTEARHQRLVAAAFPAAVVAPLPA